MAIARRLPTTTERLRAEIDRGRARDKVAVFDPAAAPLGTDAEAAGTPPDRERIAAAEREELESAPPPPAAASDGRLLVVRSAQISATILVPAFLLWLVFA
jgi:hypothetical protein